MTAMDNTVSQLLGRWDLVSWYQDYDDGRTVFPFGENAIGFIVYAASGHMACMMACVGRQNFTTGGQWGASEAERAAAYDSFMAYSGTFTVADDIIRHHVDLTLYPNWLGSSQARSFQLDGDELYLKARLEEKTTEARNATLRWKRNLAGQRWVVG